MNVISDIFSKPLDFLEINVIPAGDLKWSRGIKADLDEHAEMLMNEFLGKSQLLLYHALLQVFLRRNISIEANFGRLVDLWVCKRDFLLRELDLRWLVSSCDSISDLAPSGVDRSVALLGSLLVNVVKLYETEKMLSGGYKNQEYAKLTRDRRELFSGVTAFALGRGDMISNLVKRIDAVVELSDLVGPIVREIYRRVRQSDTVFFRFSEFQPVEL